MKRTHRTASIAVRGLVAIALLGSAACSLDFTRYRADAATDRTMPIDVLGIDRVDQTAEPMDRPIVDQPPVLDLGPEIETPDVIDIVDEPAGPCGDVSQPCCATTPACTTGLACLAGVCVTCGANSEPCCDGACAVGSTCVGTTCRSTCGAISQSCCSGACSNDVAVCSSGNCVACGGVLQLCCASGCHAGFACASTGRCTECGHFGELCCTGATPCLEGSCQATASSGMVCLGNTANLAGGTCTSAGMRCSDNSVCDSDGFCGPCGGQAEPCCFTTDCRDPLTCSGALTRCR